MAGLAIEHPQVHQAWQPQPAQPQLDRHQLAQPQWHGEWGAPPPPPCYDQPAGQAFPCMQGPTRLLQPGASPRLMEPGMPQLEASGSGQTTLAHTTAQHRQLDAFGCPPSPARAASLGSLPSLDSLPPLHSPLIAAAVPSADVPWHLGHFASCRLPLAPPRQQQQGQRTTQPPSHESCAASRQKQLPGGPAGHDGASSQRPPRQPASVCSLEMMQAAGPAEPEQMKQMLALARELGLLPCSAPGSPAGPQPSWVPLLKGCTPPPPGHHLQHAESELLRQFSGQLDLPLVDQPPQQETAATGPELEAPVLQPALQAHLPTAPQVQLRPVGMAAPQPLPQPSLSPQRLTSAAGAGNAAVGAPVLLTPAAMPPLQRAALPPPQQAQQAQQRKEKKSSKGKQEQKLKQPQLKQKQMKKPPAKRQQLSPGGRQAGGQTPATAKAPAQPASVSVPQQLLLQAGMKGLTTAMFAELRRQQQERQAAEAAAWHREQRAILQQAQAEQRRQLELAQQAQLLQLEHAQLVWQTKRAAEQRAEEPTLPGQLAASPQQPTPTQLAASPQQPLPQLERQPSAAQLPARELAVQPSLGQRTLSVHLEQEEGWARQRAEQQLWAQAAACLVARSSSMEAGRLSRSPQR